LRRSCNWKVYQGTSVNADDTDLFRGPLFECCAAIDKPVGKAGMDSHTTECSCAAVIKLVYPISKDRLGDIACGMDGSEEIRDMYLYVHDERLQASRISLRMKILSSGVSEDATIAYPNLVGSSVHPSYRGQLGEGTEGLEGEVRGGSSLEGAGKGWLWRKARKGIDEGAQRVNTLLSHLSCL
jgi:hypothetical protein